MPMLPKKEKHEITMHGYQCQRPNCLHKWVPKKRAYPTVCPKCKSPYWDRAIAK